MRRVLHRTLIWIAVPALAAGCAAPLRDDALVSQTVAPSSDADGAMVWEAAQNVLREHHFRLDRVDRRAGLISTDPQTSQHLFELWRKDVDTPYDFLEATLRTVRRSVEVTVASGAAGDEVSVRVHKEFFSTPERQFNSSIATMRMFGNELPRADTGERITDADSRWIDAGRDPAMERYLLERIVKRAGGAT